MLREREMNPDMPFCKPPSSRRFDGSSEEPASILGLSKLCVFMPPGVLANRV